MRFKAFLALILVMSLGIGLTDYQINQDSSFIAWVTGIKNIDNERNVQERALARSNAVEESNGSFVIQHKLKDYIKWGLERNLGLNEQGNDISDKAAEYMGYVVAIGQQLYDTGSSQVQIPLTIDSKQLITDISRLMNCVVGFRVDVKGTERKNENGTKLNIQIYYKEDETFNESENGTEIWRYSIESMVTAISNLAQEEYTDKSEQLLFINDYLATSCKYDTESAENANNVDDSAWSAYGCLVENSAVCEGYTNAVTLILDKLGIPSIEAIGHTSSGKLHTWNKVYLDGSWLNIDVTSNSTGHSESENKKINSIIERERRRFFLISDNEMYNKGIEESNTDLMLSWLIKFGERVYNNPD